MNSQYLLVLFYRNKHMKECRSQEIILIGNEDNIRHRVSEKIRSFEYYNNNNCKVEQYSLFKHITSKLIEDRGKLEV